MVMNSTERNDLIVSWLTLGFAFSLLISNDWLNLMSFAEAIPIALLAVGTGFVFHEMAHRQMARSYGFHAEFRAWTQGLIFAVLIAFISGGRFIFAAPGATYIFATNISREKNGKISFAGPAVNMVLGFILIFLSLLSTSELAFKILFNAAWINFWFAFFNLLPLGPLDGTKVFMWNKGVWIAGILVAGTMALFPQAIFIFAP